MSVNGASMNLGHVLWGFLSPNNQYNIYWTKYSRLSKYLFLSSSYPKTQLLVPEQWELPIETYTTDRPLCRYKSSFLVEQQVLGKLLEW